MKVSQQIPLLLAALAVLSAGCASVKTDRMYPGDPRPSSEVATVVVPNEINILTVDDRKIPHRSNFRGQTELRLELLPGDHAIVARYYSPSSFDEFGRRQALPDRSAPIELHVSAKAGKTYRMIATIGQEKIDLAIVEAETGEEAAGGTSSATTPPITTAPAVAPISEPPADQESNALRALKTAWENAPAADRERFKQWAPEGP